MATLAEIYDWFMTSKKPTQAQFWASWGSFWNKNESIPQSSISGLTSVLNAKVENDQFNAHKGANDAHATLFQAKEDKTQKGAPNGYAPLDEFTKLAAQYLNIVDDLVTGGDTALLSAEQGKVLQTQVNAINTLLTSDNVNLDTVQELVDAIETVQLSLSSILVNDLTTGGTTKALTAEMGKVLKGLIDALTLLTNQKLSLTGGNLTGNTGFGVPNPLAKIHSDGTVIHKNLTNAQGDTMFTKQVVAKTDGTFGVIDLPSADSWSSPISLAPFLANGVTSPNASYRRKGNVIQLTLSVSGATPLNTFITLPPELRHAGNFIYLTGQVGTQPRLLVFSSDGTIKTFDGSSIVWGEISLMAQYSV